MTSPKLSLLIVSAEYSPWAKTGGLGDMVSALAAGLCSRGHDVRLVLPLYRRVRQAGIRLDTAIDSLCVRMGMGEVWCAVRRHEGRDGVPVYFVEHDVFFDRPGLYQDPSYGDYGDNPYRFGFFGKAALDLAAALGFSPDIVQVHDWQTALAPAYLKTWFAGHPLLGACRTVLTIHNESFQGNFSGALYDWLGLPGDPWNPGRLGFLKEGIRWADGVNTVSPTHAKEMGEPGGGFGLAPDIAAKGERFRGILNGADYGTWSPERDPYLPRRYSAADPSGKAVCKAHLQRAFGLAEDPAPALIGFIGRLTPQKGVHLLTDVMEGVVRNMHAQFVVLGSGDPAFEHTFGTLPGRYPGRIGSWVGFDERLAHLIEAGADFFVMPSLYEPCGLNQMYSLRYGTLPIVHAVGGLEDTVENYDEATGKGTGFKFHDATPAALYTAIGRAVSTYFDRPEHLRCLRQAAMAQDFSWEKSIRQYEGFFAWLKER